MQEAEFFKNHPPPLRAINQFSCGLACVCYLLNWKTELRPTQESLLLDPKLKDEFPKWKIEPGVLDQGGMVTLLGKMGLAYTSFFGTRNWRLAWELILKLGIDKMIAGFVLRRKPFGHGYLILGISGEESSHKAIPTMDPSQENPRLWTYDSDELSRDSDCDYLIFFR